MWQLSTIRRVIVNCSYFLSKQCLACLAGYTSKSNPSERKPLYLYRAVVTGIGLLLKGALWQP